MGVGGQRHIPTALPPGKWPGTHFTGAWGAPVLVWMGAENLAPTGIRSPDRQARGDSLHNNNNNDNNNNNLSMNTSIYVVLVW